jgi:hypothetical protein
MLSYQVDPLNSEIFRTYANSDQSANLGGFRDTGLMQTLSQLPGAEAFYRPNTNFGDSTDPYGIDPQLLAEYLQQMGYSIFDDANEAGGTLRVMDGDNVLGSESYSNKDSGFGFASSLLGAAGGGLIGGMAGLGSIGTGALSGGMAAGAQDPELSSIAKGAAVGGLMGGAQEYLSADGYSGLDYGDGSAFPAGDGSAWTAPVPPSVGVDWSYGGGSDPNLLTGGGNVLTGGLPTELPPSLPSFNVPTGGVLGAVEPIKLPDNFADVSDITGPIDKALDATPPATDSLKTLPADVAPAAGSSIWDTIKNNPQLVGAITGGLLGGVDGGSSGGGATPYTGPMPTITRGDWKPSAQASLMQVPQFGQGLMSGPGVANSGLWRFKG